MSKKAWWVLLLLVALGVQFWPTIGLNNGMVRWETDQFVLFYDEQDQFSAEAVLSKLETDAPLIHQRLNYYPISKTEVYIYSDQKTMQQKKYGYLGSLLNLAWYIGDNVGDKVIMVSPAHPGPVHSRESVIQVASHEYVHSLIHRINKDVPLWLNEGVTLYLTNGAPLKTIRNTTIPTWKQTKSNNPLVFANANGYSLAHIYIEFLEQTYGFEQVLTLLADPTSHRELFGRSEKQLYNEWVEYLQRNYP